MLLSVDNVDAGYGDLQVLWGVSLSLEPGKVCVVAGPNGAGKSTLLKVVSGTVRTMSGRVEIGDEDVTHTKHAKRLRGGVAWVPEGRLLFDDLSVAENLRMSAFMSGAPRREFDERLVEVTAVFPELEAWLAKSAGQLSGGQQQIVVIARALIRRPRLILLDEPSVGLAPMVVGRMGEQLRVMSALGVGILVAEQNVAWLESVADDVLILSGGRVSARVEPQMLGSRDFLRQAYLSV